MAREIVDWLEGLGLARYAEVFLENEIDLDTLAHLRDADLRELGLPMGPRRKLLVAIAARVESTPSLAPDAFDKIRSEAERRQLTVMFCDLVGSTALSGRLTTAGSIPTSRAAARWRTKLSPP